MSERWLEFRLEDDCKHESDIYGPYCPLCEIERLRGALQKIANEIGSATWVSDIAKQALDQQEGRDE